MTLLKRRMAWQRIEREPDRHIDLRCLLLASFTVNSLAPYLGGALVAGGFAASVETGPFDQISQQLFSFDSSNDVVVVWQRIEELFARSQFPLVAGDADSAVESMVVMGTLCVRRSAETGTTVIVVLPAMPELVPLGVGDASNRFGVAASTARARQALLEAVAGAPGILVFDSESVIREIGSRNAIDHRRMAAGSIPYTEEAFALVGERMATLLRVARKGARKVAVVDADNTLWGGVVGEEGTSGVDLSDQGPGVSYREFQRYLLELRRAGTLIAVASKNNEPDALDVFNRAEMRLRVEDLAAWRINWEPKSVNIEAMADQLNLGTASMVFIDDSAMERAQVAGAVEGISVLEMPEDPACWFDSIARSGALDRLPPTSSDLGRAESYSVESRRVQSRGATSIEAFLASLNLVATIAEPTEADLARFAQLIAKTNQFTLGGHRYSEAELRSKPPVQFSFRLASLKDNFGDYGVVGAFIVDLNANRLDTLVLSCRAMGRGLEDAMLAEAFDICGVDELFVEPVETQKNMPMLTWLGSKGFQFDQANKPLARQGWPAHIRRT